MLPQLSALIFFIPAILAQSPTYGCPPDGPLLPKPTTLSESSFVHNATETLQDLLDQAVAGDINAGWAVENTSFSLALVSFDQPDPAQPVWEYHHRGSANTEGVEEINGETQYLIGSISKLFSGLLLLKTGVDLEKPITEYLPELAEGDSVIQWGNITLASLVDHLSGIPPNYGFSEFYFLASVFEQLGYPPLAAEDYATCGIAGLNRPCTQEDVLNGMRQIRPVVNPYDRPLYSQLSYSLLSYALNASLGKNYTELLDEYIVQPLNLTNTGASPGNNDRAVIPPVENSWGADYGDNAPGGGLYSSTNDLTKLIHSILNYSVLDTETDVKAWLKPYSTTSSPQTLVGAPWEIFRSTNLTPAHPHTIDLYSKNGGAYGYISQMSVIDQYGIGLVLTTAGAPEAWKIIYDSTLSLLLPAVEEEARAQAQEYTGLWSGPESDPARVEMNVTIDDGPGVKLNAVTRNGSDILAALPAFFSSALPQFGMLSPDLRLYPTLVTESATLDAADGPVNVTREDWRLNLNFVPNTAETSGSDLPGQGAMQDFCDGWQTADWVWYGGEGLDRFVFVRSAEGDKEVIGVEYPALRSGVLGKS